MPVNMEWSVPHTLVTPFATIDLNTIDPYTGRKYQILPDGYKIVPAMRVTQDNISERDGSIEHPKYKTGLVASLTVRYVLQPGGVQSDAAPACGADLRLMDELLTGALDSIRADSPDEQRLYWQPEGYGDLRLLDAIETLAWLDPSFDDDLFPTVTFQVETPFPYAIDFTQQDTTIDNTTATITNPGTSDFLPVLKVHAGSGDLDTFTIVNDSVLDADGNPVGLVYDSSRPGADPIPAGHYAAIDFFRGTIFEDGTGADLTAGLDPSQSDFFPLVPGDNVIVTDCNAEFLWNPAWS